jgi:hypothetical protein
MPESDSRIRVADLLAAEEPAHEAEKQAEDDARSADAAAERLQAAYAEEIGDLEDALSQRNDRLAACSAKNRALSARVEELGRAHTEILLLGKNPRGDYEEAFNSAIRISLKATTAPGKEQDQDG